MTTTRVMCPPWCSHHPYPPGRTHTLDLGDVELPSGTTLGIGLAEYGDEQRPVVTLTLDTYAGAVTALGLDIDRARDLREMLGHAIATLENQSALLAASDSTRGLTAGRAAALSALLSTLDTPGGAR